MPRARLPKLTARPKVVPFKLTRSDEENIAGTIPGAKDLSPQVKQLIEENVTAYRAAEQGSSSCTVANTRFVLRQLEKKGRGRQDALDLLSNDRAAVDYETLDRLQFLAKATRNKEAGAEEALLKAARQRDAELKQHPRVTPRSEPLRFFCGVLRKIFKVASAHLDKPTSEEEWRLCRRFASAVLKAANIERDHFIAHPDRFTEYLQTDVTID
jgi:hypothetical protein